MLRLILPNQRVASAITLPATGKEAYGKWLVIVRSIEQDSKIGCQRLCEIVDRAVFDERR